MENVSSEFLGKSTSIRTTAPRRRRTTRSGAGGERTTAAAAEAAPRQAASHWPRKRTRVGGGLGEGERQEQSYHTGLIYQKWKYIHLQPWINSSSISGVNPCLHTLYFPGNMDRCRHSQEWPPSAFWEDSLIHKVKVTNVCVAVDPIRHRK